MKLYVFGTLLVVAGLLSNLSRTTQKQQNVRESVIAQLGQLQLEVEQYKSNLSCNKETSIEAFDQIRLQYKSVEWLLLPTLDAQELEQLSNSKFWVQYQDALAQEFPEAGAFQIIEQALQNESTNWENTIWTEADQLLAILEIAVERIQQLQLDEGAVFYLLSTNLSYHYLTTLNAYDRLNAQQSVQEFRQAVKSQIEILELHLPKKKAVKRVIKTLNQLDQELEDQQWEDIDRAALYKEWIAPTVEQYRKLALTYGYHSGQGNAIGLETHNLFSDRFFNLHHFLGTDTISNASSLIELGKQLFYDPILSGNNKRTCASCHKATKAFTDGRQTSMGFDLLSRGKRNAPSLINSIYKRQFQHDLSQDQLFDQVTFVVHHPMEFNTSWQQIEQKIATSEQYVEQFEQCFQQKTIDSTQLATALVAYLSTLRSFNSPFDQYMRDEIDAIDDRAVEGYNLFMGKAQCGNCHFPPLFSGLNPNKYQHQTYSKINSPDIKTAEKGLAGNVNYDERYLHFFNVPTLRNLSFTSPYLHNGSLFSIADCITAHKTTTLSHLQNLTNDEMSALLHFLAALNDTTLIPEEEEVLVLPPTDGTLVPAQRRSAGIY